VGKADVEAMVRLKSRLERVLADNDGVTMIPASAGHMSTESWEAMSRRERAVFVGMQLRRLDPRLLSVMVMTRSRGQSHLSR